MLARFGEDAAIAKVPGSEGEFLKGVSLFTDDAERKLNIYFFDDEMTQLATVQPDGHVKRWKVAGLELAMDLDAVTEANGGPFKLSDFEWDYDGGYIVNFLDGKLGALNGGCSLSVRFDMGEFTEAPPPGIMGETTFSSQTADLQGLKPTVGTLALGWRAQK